MKYSGLIVGLGNPGRKYQNTRHNVGFNVIDHILRSSFEGYSEQIIELKSKKTFLLWQCFLKHDSTSFLLCQPQTYMNLSGLAVKYVLKKYFLSSENFIVVHDDLDLPFGRLRFKFGGGNAGHNGLRSITEEIGTSDFYRLRVGLGRPEPGVDVSKYVLQPFEADEQKNLSLIFKQAVQGLYIFWQKGVKEAMNQTHSFSLPATS
jgi:PTH1 family peptidyl-tRNA hydrolase